jgi:GR25 family glycosyltransferase involved in LPS biosynthesis
LLYYINNVIKIYYFNNNFYINSYFISKNDKIELYSKYKSLPIIFIVLKRDKEINQYIKKIIKNNNLNYYNIVDATGGQNLNLQYFINTNYITFLASKNMRVSAIGCAISHIKLWEKKFKWEDTFLILMEGGVHLKPKFNKNLYNYLNHLPNNFDISYLLIHPHKSSQNKFIKSININGYVKKGFGQWGTSHIYYLEKELRIYLKLLNQYLNL